MKRKEAMKKQRRKHTPEFKAQVALEAVKGIETTSQIAARYEIHPTLVSSWKNELMKGAGSIFASSASKADKVAEKAQEKLERKVGQLTMEVDFLEKKCDQLGIPYVRRT